MFRNAAIVAAALVATSHAAFAEDCLAPAGPDMTAEGTTLSVETFNNITRALGDYDAGLKTYRNCLDDVIHHPQAHSPEAWRAALDAYNNTSTEQAALYERYDVVSADFQKAQANRAAQAATADKANSATAIQAELAAELAVMNQ